MKRNRKEKVDATDLIHKLEFAQKCADVGEDFDSVKSFGSAIQQIKDCYDWDPSVQNPYIDRIFILKSRALVKCDVWAKMAVVDFGSKYGIWIPKVLDSFKHIKYFNGCN